MKGLCGDENDDNNEDEGEHSTRIFFTDDRIFLLQLLTLKSRT